MIYEVKRGNTIIWSGLAFGSQFKRIMQEDRVEVSISTPSAITFKKGDTLIAYGQTYKLNRPENISKKNTQVGYSYDIEFEALYYDFGKWILYTLDKNNALKEPAVYLMGDAKAILGLVIQNANRASSGWTLGVVDDTEVFQWGYSGAKLLTVIQDIADQTNLEFWFDNGGKRLNLTRRQPVTGIELAYGKGNGLYELFRSRRDNPVVTHLTILGGSQNIPNNYGFRNIQPTGGNPMVNPNYVEGMDRVEDTVVYENIYPRLIAKVTAANAPNVITSTDIDFNLNGHLLDDGTSAQIAFTSGLLNGFKFTIVGYNHPARQIAFAIIQDDKAYPGGVPNSLLKPAVGDTFVFLNIDMPASYVTNSEARVKETGDQYFAEEGVEQFDWSAKITPKFALENNTELVLGGLVRLKADDIGFDGNIRIDSYSRDLQESYRYDFTLSNIISINSLVRQRNQSDRLANTVSKGISSDGLSTKATYAERAGYAGTAGHAATATNAATANFASEAQHASTANHANTASTANYATTAGHANTADYALDSDKWDGRQFADNLDQPVRTTDDVRHKSVSSPTYTSGATGHGFKINADGSAEFDSVSIRKSLNVVQLNVREITGTGGSFAVTNVAKIESVFYWAEHGYYECRINTDDGTIFVPFLIGDLVRCQVWDGQGVKYYVARVGAVYSSASKFDIVIVDGAGIPEAGDTVFQWGSSVTDRQGLIYMTNSDMGAPYLDVLDGITSPDLAGKTKVRLGKLNGITDAVFGALNGYGLYSQNAYLRGNFWVTGGNAETQDGSQSKANTAQTNAINSASLDATNKANNAYNNAVNAAASDASSKMNNAITSANQFTQNAVDAIQIGARNYARNSAIKSTSGYAFINAIATFQIENINELRVTGANAGYFYTPNLAKTILLTDTVTISYWVKNNASTQNIISVTLNGNGGFGGDVILPNQGWTRIVKTGLVSNATANHLNILLFENYNGGSFDISLKEIMVTVGNKEVDWQVASEDLENALEVYKTEVSQSFSVTNGLIAGKVNQSDFNALGQVVSNQGTSITANAIAIEDRATKTEFTQLNNTVGGIEGRVTTAEAAIVTQAGQIALTATKSEVTTAIGNIKVGGINLLRNSAAIKKAIYETTEGYNQFWRVDITHVDSFLKIGDDVCISFDIQMEVGTLLSVYDSNNYRGKYFGSNSFHNIGNLKQRLIWTTVVKDQSNGADHHLLDFYNGNNGDRFTIENIQIEIGNKATPWKLNRDDETIGGTNYYSNRLTPVSAYDGAYDAIKNSENGFIVTGGTSGASGVRISNVIDSNGWWTVSGWVRGTQGINAPFHLDICDGIISQQFRSNANEWTYFEYSSYVNNYTASVYNFVDIGNLSNLYYQFKDIQIEKSNKASDWKPSFKDIDQEFTDAKNRLDTAEFKLQPTQIDAVVSSLDYKTGAQVAAGFQVTSGGMSVFGQFHSFNGAVTFNSLDPSTQGSINTANSNASSALANAATANTAAGNAQNAANTAQSSANTANSNLSTLQGSLGSLAYDNAVTLAKLDSTIIIGGYFKTNLINATEVFAQNITATGLITALNLNVIGSSKVGAMSINNDGYMYNNAGNGGLLVTGGGIIASVGPKASPETLGVSVAGWFSNNKSGSQANHALVVEAKNSSTYNDAITVLNGAISLMNGNLTLGANSRIKIERAFGTLTVTHTGIDDYFIFRNEKSTTYTYVAVRVLNGMIVEYREQNTTTKPPGW